MTSNNQHIPSGYKSSPLGIIPEDWEVKRLGEICTFLRNNTLSRNQLNETNGKVQDVHYGDILVKYPSILNASAESIPYINQEDYKDTLNEFIENGDVIMADTAEDETVGKACEIINVDSKRILAGLHTMLIRPQKGLFASSFLGYHINSNSYRKQLNALMQGIKVCSLGKQVIANTFLLLPPLPEQHRIVSVLSLWDTAIAKQTALIEKLTLRKRGLMQQLLTGKKRLKGFGGEWKEVRLGEIATFFSGGTPKSTNKSYYNGDIPFIRSGEIDKEKTELFISQEGINNSSAKIVEKGDVLYALYGATSGQCSLSKIRGAINQAILCIRPNANKYFIVSVLQFNKEIYYNSYLQGGQGNLSGEIVSNYRILIPSIDEQNAIASVLINADKEIEIANEKLLHLQEEKRGLMQVLLTGKKRIK